MPRLRRRAVFLPVAFLFVLVLITALLGRFGVLSIPGISTAEPGIAHASDSTAAADSADVAKAGDGEKKKKKKKGKKGDEDEPPPPVPVELAQAARRQISAYYRSSSVFEADRHVDLVTKKDGRIRSVEVEEGDWVKKGAVLAELENERERIQLRQAELRLEQDGRELERAKSLLDKQLITRENYDARRSEYDLRESERDIARIALEEMILRAPFSGQVTDRKVVRGQHVVPAQAMFTLVDLDPIRVRIHLPESIARKVRPGDAVLVTADAVPDALPATVERISPVVDPATSTVRLTLLLEGDPEEVRVGGFVKVRVTTDTHTEALAVPKSALVEEGGLRSVFVAVADSVHKVEVETGLYDESHVEVLDGVERNAYVVTVGHGGLRGGSKIEVLNAAEIGWAPPEPVKDEDTTSVALGEGKDAP